MKRCDRGKKVCHNIIVIYNNVFKENTLFLHLVCAPDKLWGLYTLK